MSPAIPTRRPTRRGARLRLAGVLAAALAAVLRAPALAGQPASPSAPPPPLPIDPAVAVCLASLPATALRPVAVYADAELPDSAPPGIASAADLLTHTVAERVRARLGATADRLPLAPSELSWLHLGAALVVTARPDGRLTWRVMAGAAPPEQAAGSAAGLLARALDEMVKGGDSPFFWPDGWARDSVTFRIVLRRPTLSASGAVRPAQARAPAPLFALAVPWDEPPVVRRKPELVYPAMAGVTGAAGAVIAHFVVDTGGRVDPSTVRDVWPAGQPRLTRQLEAYYRAFVGAVRDALAKAEYEPARIGGCRVPRIVEQAFAFEIRPR